MGRDLYSRTVYRARVSLAVGFAVAMLSVAIGLCVGLLTGFVETFDAVAMRVVDGLMALPSILLAVALIALTGASHGNVIMAITLSAVRRTDPDAARIRTILKGDLPSPVDPPSGCAFGTAPNGRGPRRRLPFRATGPDRSGRTRGCPRPATVWLSRENPSRAGMP